MCIKQSKKKGRMVVRPFGVLCDGYQRFTVRVRGAEHLVEGVATTRVRVAGS